MNRRRFPRVALILLLAVAAGAVAWSRSAPADTLHLPTSTDQSVLQMLDHVTVINSRPNPPGYDRDCGTGQGCVFGPAWTDVDRNGCDTRNDVLAAQLDKGTVVFRPGSGRRQCVVISGTGRDPYTSGLIAFRKADAGQVEIDHVYPLALAWDMGANTWTTQRRTQFANDQANLRVTLRASNRAKSDKSPAEWIDHVAPTLRCPYIHGFLTVALAYQLPITKADADAIRTAATHCV